VWSALAKNSVVKEILKRYSQVWAINHSLAVMGWDRETHMPEAGAHSRAMASGQLAMMYQKAVLELKGLASKAERQRDLDDLEKGVVRVMRRDLHYYTRVPPELVDGLERATGEATVVWRTARKRNQFKVFEPHLAKIIGINRKIADKLGYKGHPYNALLNLYEEDFTVKDADKVFSRLVPGTRKTLAKVTAAGVYPSKHPLESMAYETPAMERVNQGVLKMLQMPTDSFRMDVSTHPFTTGIAPDDVRITTRYEGTDFRATLFSTIHESGHALYDLGVAQNLAYTPLWGGASLGLHESQSRFWENVVGRSREFTKLANPLMKKNLKFLARYDSEDVYYYFNMIRRSLIRVDADELTYNLHIALRYEIEKKMIAGEVEASELPELWNDTFEEYLGIRPPTDTQGVLQDVHWGSGSMGYFPTYSLGNVILGMIWHAMGDGKKVREAVAEGDLVQLRTWLKTKIHRWGAVYSPKVLQGKVFGESYNPEWLLKYQEAKYLG
jgi:carboxypeptidase Taq